MKTLYDVQQFLKQFGIIVYMGKRLYDIELMKIELSRIYDAGLMDKLDYLEAEAVLRREHKLELDYLEKMEIRYYGNLGIMGTYSGDVRMDGIQLSSYSSCSENCR